MRPWNRFGVFFVVVFAIASTTLASTSSLPAISDDEPAYLAPMLDFCEPKDPTCEAVKDKYMVTLREGYPPSSHLSYIAANINIDPLKDWKIRWSNGDQLYTISDVSEKHIDIIRRDRGVEEVEPWAWIVMHEVDICRNPKLSEEERKICYEEEDLPQCERPSLSTERRISCFADTKFLSCIPPQASEEELRICCEESLIDPCENPKLEEEERRFCREGSLFATSTNLQLSIFDEGRRTCARKPEVRNPKAVDHKSSDTINLRNDDNLAPLYEAFSADKSPETYIVTLYRDIDYSYQDHFKTIGRDLEADDSTGFKWWDVADSYYATNITSEWVRSQTYWRTPSRNLC